MSDIDRGTLRLRMDDSSLQADICKADLVWGECPHTGHRTGPYYGISALKRIVRTNNSEDVFVVTIPVDPETDDVECLCAMVTMWKGACCYEAFMSQEEGGLP